MDEADLPETAFPLTFSNLAHVQNAQKDLFTELNHPNTRFHLMAFHGGGKAQELICRDGKILIPTALQNRVPAWYHVNLCHPGETRTDQTIRQHFWWLSIRKDVHEVCSKCPTCQLHKKSSKKY